jgi:alkylation response protein AidB-like acyl-CoA dehydrogenase
MDLDLTDEQVWLSESIETLLTRQWPVAEHAWQAGGTERERLWSALAEFGALAVDREEGLGAVELALVARALGAHLASVPFLGTAAVRFALEPFADELPAGFAQLTAGADRLSVALLEPGGSWSVDTLRMEVGDAGLNGEKVAVEHAGHVDQLAVLARVDGTPGLVVVPAGAQGVEIVGRPGLDAGVPMSAITFTDVDVGPTAGRPVVDRLLLVGALLAAGEAVGAAGRLLEDARAYAAERRQFGRTIGSYQALRHLMADMYVRHASSWSTVLYAAAALDDDVEDAAQTVAVAKAYVSRAAREVAHGALQVFGGIAFTEEHPAHRFLRRIVVREQQFGDAALHERAIGRMLAARAVSGEHAVPSPDADATPVG